MKRPPVAAAAGHRLDPRMTRRGALLAASVALAGCAATFRNPLVVDKGTITLDQKRFRDAYEHIKTVYLRVHPIVIELCANGCLGVERCAAALEADRQFRRLDIEAETIMRNPDTEPNWDVIFKLVSTLVGFVL